MNRAELPIELHKSIGDEEIDFIVFAKRRLPRTFSYRIVLFGIIWLVFSSFITLIVVSTLLIESTNVQPIDKLGSLTLSGLISLGTPGFIVMLFLLVGIAIVAGGVLLLFKKGGYFVGTENKIIRYLNGHTRYYNWDQFTGNVELNFKKKNISLEMRKGSIISIDDLKNVLIRNYLHLSGIENAKEIDNKCRKRINESQSKN